jgi:hypothetical protein
LSSAHEPFDLDALLNLWSAPPSPPAQSPEAAPPQAISPPAPPVDSLVAFFAPDATPPPPAAAPPFEVFAIPSSLAQSQVLAKQGGESQPSVTAPLLPEIGRKEAADREPPKTSAPEAFAALLSALHDAFGGESKEFAIARDMLENGGDKIVLLPIDAMKVGDLVRVLFPIAAAPPAGDALAVYRDKLAKLLDQAEDVLDGLMLAVEARA